MTYLNDLIDLKKQKQMSHQYLSNGMKHHSKQTRGQIAVDRRQTKRDRFIQKKKKKGSSLSVDLLWVHHLIPCRPNDKKKTTRFADGLLWLTRNMNNLIKGGWNRQCNPFFTQLIPSLLNPTHVRSFVCSRRTTCSLTRIANEIPSYLE